MKEPTDALLLGMVFGLSVAGLMSGNELVAAMGSSLFFGVIFLVFRAAFLYLDAKRN